MKPLLAVVGISALLVMAPAGCVATLALGAGSIAAATTDPRCLSEETSDPAACVPSWASSGPRANPVVMDPGGVPAPSAGASAAVESAIAAVGRGAPLPEAPRPTLLAGNAPPELWDSLAAHVAQTGFRLERVRSAADIGGANGVTDFGSRTVQVRSDVSPAQAAKTLAHELGQSPAP